MYSFLCPQEFVSGNITLPQKYDIGFLGTSYDPRGNVSRRKVKDHSKQQIDFAYNHESLTVEVNSIDQNLRDFFNGPLLSDIRTILIDATNLAFAEIASIFRLINNKKNVQKVSFIYCEPEVYNSKVWTPTDVRSFQLTESLSEPDFIPTYYNQASLGLDKYLLAFLGFEDTRFARIIDPDLNANYAAIGAAFSVPPFKTGFDTHSFMANGRVLENNHIEEPFFISGNQPYDAYNLIKKLKRQCVVQKRELIIAPIGTKPTAIATVLAAVEDPSIGVVFDFPKKRSQRSTGIGSSHYYPIELK